MAEPLNVVVTGAAGQIGYAILYAICKGDVFGPNQPVILRLLDIPPMMTSLGGLCMELEDCAFPLLKGVVPTDDPAVAFKDVEAAFLIGAMPRREGMERKDLLAANVKIFKTQGQALDQHAKKTCKILVVGNPANTNACICSKYAPSIPKENFSAMTRLDQNRASAQIALKVGASVSEVKNVIIWGNHSSTQYPDVSHATVVKDGKKLKVEEAVNDMDYLKNEFITTVQKRGAAVIAARKLSSALSAAKAACDHMRSWWLGTPEGEWVSMGVLSDGSYQAPAGLIFSFPVQIDANRNWKIVQDLPMSNFSLQKIGITADELEQEKNLALSVCED